MCSTPAATTRSRCPAWIADAPLKAACSDEPHCRSTVVAQTVSGQPATSTAPRPTFSACSPTCVTQPICTSSISPGSRSTRPTRPFSTCAASSSARMSASEPFRRPIGERTASTMYAPIGHHPEHRTHARSARIGHHYTPAWPRPRSSDGFSSTASGSRRATGSRSARRTTRRSSARVAKGGADEARLAVDAAERAMQNPLPAHERAAILDRTARLIDERSEEIARTISSEAGKPMKAARVEVARAMSTFTMAAVEARKLAGEVVPMDASPAGAGKLALTLRVPIGVVGAISPVQLPVQPRRPQGRAGARRRLRGRAQAGVADAAVGAPPRRARDRGRAAAGLAQRRLRLGRARSATCSSRTSASALITFTGSAGVGWRSPRARAAQAREPRARQRDARDRRRGRRPRRRRDAARGECVLVRRPELHLGAADLRRARRVRRIPRAFPPEGRRARGRRPGRRRDRRRPAHRHERARPCPRVDRGSDARAARASSPAERSTASSCGRP